MDKFRTDAKRYVEQIYLQHKEDDIEAWNNLIDILFNYIEESLRVCKETHK